MSEMHKEAITIIKMVPPLFKMNKTPDEDMRLNRMSINFDVLIKEKFKKDNHLNLLKTRERNLGKRFLDWNLGWFMLSEIGIQPTKEKNRKVHSYIKALEKLNELSAIMLAQILLFNGGREHESIIYPEVISQALAIFQIRDTNPYSEIVIPDLALAILSYGYDKAGLNQKELAADLHTLFSPKKSPIDTFLKRIQRSNEKWKKLVDEHLRIEEKFLS